MAYTDINSEDRLVQATFAEHGTPSLLSRQLRQSASIVRG